MSVEAGPSPANVLELPSTGLARIIQHVASGSGGLASAAALSQTCKSFYALSESSAVTYRNLHVDKPVNSLDDPFYRWLHFLPKVICPRGVLRLSYRGASSLHALLPAWLHIVTGQTQHMLPAWRFETFMAAR